MKGLEVNFEQSIVISTHEGTCPRDKSLQQKVPSCELPICVKKSCRGECPTTCPTNLNWFELKGGTCSLKLCLFPRVYCLWDKSLRPNKKINQSKTKSDCPCNKPPRVYAQGTCSRDTVLVQVPATNTLV